MAVSQAQDELDAQDPVRLAAEARLGRRGFGQARRTITEGLRIVRRAAPTSLRVNLALQLLSVAVIVLQLVLARGALQSLRAGGQGPVDPSLAPLLLGLAGAVALGQALQAVTAAQQALLGEQVTRSVWDALLEVACRVPLTRFEDPTFHDRLQRVRTFALVRPLEISNAVGGIASAALTALALVAVLVGLDALLLPLLLIAGVPLLLVGRASTRESFRFAVRQTLNQRKRFYLTELLTSSPAAKEVRAFDLGQPLLERYLALHDQHVDATRHHGRRQARHALMAAAVAAIALGSTFLLLLELVQRERLSLPEAAVAALVLRLLATRLQALASAISKLLGAGLFLEDLITFLDQPVVAARSPAPRAANSLALRLEGVSFTYPGAHAPAVQELSLDLLPGQVVALVGENGSGKTTLAKILAGLYEPTAGSISWEADGRPVQAQDVRDHLAVLFQDFNRYELSARENVALGRLSAPLDDDRISTALRGAAAERIVAELPQGLDTVLSSNYPGGRDLSGGQWQRIALARALYRDAPLVILDEPTAALDPRAEHELFRDLRTVLGGRTVVLVSHRFSTVKDADLILVLDRGRVLERGTHQQLLDLGGTYADLYELQARAYVRDEPQRPARQP